MKAKRPSDRERRCVAEFRLISMKEENDKLRAEIRSRSQALNDLELRALRAEDEVYLLKKELAQARESKFISKLLGEEKSKSGVP